MFFVSLPVLICSSGNPFRLTYSVCGQMDGWAVGYSRYVSRMQGALLLLRTRIPQIEKINDFYHYEIGFTSVFYLSLSSLLSTFFFSLKGTFIGNKSSGLSALWKTTLTEKIG